MLPRGKRIDVETMLHGLLLPSGNDAAIALALRAAGSQPRFIAMMNRQAREMGLVCSHFSTVSGIKDRGNHSCAPDLAAMARAVLRQPRLARIVGRRSAVLPFPIKGHKLYLYNNNPLLRAGYRGHDRRQDRLHRRGRPLPGGDRAPRADPPRRRAARLPDPGRQAMRLLDRGFKHG